jgi:hypothetical protein
MSLVGKKVRLEDGTEALVLNKWASGKHSTFELANGTKITDLDKLVDQGRVKILADPESLFDVEVSDDADEWGSVFGEDRLD